MNRLYLTVVYKDKDIVKGMGAKYDMIEKKWYIDEKDRDLFSDYLITSDKALNIDIDIDEEFNTLKKGKQIVLAKAQSKQINKRFRDTMLETLLTFHPYKIILLSDIDYLVFKYFNNTKNIMLYYKLRTERLERSIAYMTCLRNKLGLFNIQKEHRKNVNSAFRNAISNTYREKFKQSSDIHLCETCGTSTSIEIDHNNIPFSKIMDDFMNEHHISVAEVQLSNTSQNTILHKALKTSWIHYHDNIVQYRYLCKSCNASQGDGGYREKKRKKI
jgi:hypothetical protein